MVIIVTCSWGFPIPVIAVSVFLVAGLVSVPLLSPCSFRGTEKHNLCRMRFKSYFVPLVLSSFSDSLDYVELKGEKGKRASDGAQYHSYVLEKINAQTGLNPKSGNHFRLVYIGGRKFWKVFTKF